MEAETASIYSYAETGRRGSELSNRLSVSIVGTNFNRRNSIASLKQKLKRHEKVKPKPKPKAKGFQKKKGLMQEKNDWADDIIDLVTIPAPKRFINDDQGLVSKEESMERIIYLLLLISGILTLIATAFLAQMDFTNQDLEQEKVGNPRVPHVFIIYQDGLHLDFSTDETMSPSKNFDIKLRHSLPSYRHCGFNAPQQAKSTGYLAYANDKRIYIFYTDGKKDVTYIDIDTGIHRTVPNTAFEGTNVEPEIMFASSVKVGNKFFMSGDKLKKCYNLNLEGQWNSKCYIWNEKREMMEQREKFPISKYDNTCYASYNRTHFIQVGKTVNETHVTVIELSNLKQTLISYIPLFIPFYGYNDHRKTCSIIFDKLQKKSLIVLVKHHVQKGVVLHTLDMETMNWSRSATNLQHFGNQYC